MIKRLFGITLLSGLLIAGASAAHAAAKIQTHVIGNPNAPVIIEDYASLTCSHCGTFYTEVLPELQKRYIDTGKVAFVFKDFPLDGVSLRAAALAHCMPSEQYHSFITTLYKNIMAWAQNPNKVLVQYAKLGGLSDDKATACMEDEVMMDQLIVARTEAAGTYAINSTPTFVFNKGEKKLVGNHSIDEMARVIDELLKNGKGK